MKKYLRLMGSFIRASAIADLEYRANIGMKIFTDIIWYTAQLSVFAVIYRHTQSIGGWSYAEVLCYQLVLFLVDALYMIFFHENLERLPEKVRRGELDLLLAKPVNSQFMLSCQKISTAYFVNIVLVIGGLTWAVSQLPYSIPATRVVGLIAMLVPSLIIYYSTRVLLTTNTLIFVRADAIGYLWFQLYRLSFRPDSLYPLWLRYVLFTVLPIGFMVSGPATLLIKGFNWKIFCGAYVAAAISLYCSVRFWRYALRFYVSASS